MAARNTPRRTCRLHQHGSSAEAAPKKKQYILEASTCQTRRDMQHIGTDVADQYAEQADITVPPSNTRCNDAALAMHKTTN